MGGGKPISKPQRIFVGRRVRIRLPPAASLLQTDFRIMVAADALNAGAVWPPGVPPALSFQTAGEMLVHLEHGQALPVAILRLLRNV